jgi:hypothetical protein
MTMLVNRALASGERRPQGARRPTGGADMLSFDGLVAVCVLYVLGLFGSRFWPRNARWRARRAG